MVLLGAKTYTVKRYAAGSYPDLDWVDGAETELTIEASVQPARGEELLLLEEGTRKRARHKMYTYTELRTVNLDAQTSPDVVIIDGRRHHVHEAADWTDHRAPTAHYKYLLVLEGVDSDASA